MNKTFSIYTLGCKVNSYESEYLREQMEEAGFVLKDFTEECDIYLINTCTVTNQSDQKSRKIIREAKKRNSKALVVALGCFINSSYPHLIDEIDIAVGNNHKSEIVSLIKEYFKKEEKIIRIDQEQKFEDMKINNFLNRTRAFLKIQDGCNAFCSYCIIPYVRGKSSSKDPKQVIKEVNDLVNKGYKEIVLTGIHTGRYGQDININLATLLKEIFKNKDLVRLRLSSIEVNEITEEILEIFKKEARFANHFHIPLQSGSDKILKKMNRKYDKAFYEEKIKEIRKIRSDVAISTDIIVGFPEEREEDFKETLEFSKEIGFSKIHVFPYSKRENTVASKMIQVDGNIKKRRSELLRNLSHELEKQYMEKFIDKKVLVLIEEIKDSFSYGHTSNYLHVRVRGKLKHNEEYEVIIKDIKYPYMIGIINDNRS